MKVSTDIDIDFCDRNSILQHLKHIPASIKKKDKMTKHNSGVYLHEIPVDQMTGLSNIEYKEAEDRGYFKIDFLNNSIYTGIRDEDHLTALSEIEPPWELFQEPDITDILAHLNGHSNVTRMMKPSSIEELAAVLAMIRPAKRYLLGKDWDTIFSEVWIPPLDGSYYFKKSHSIAYAVSIVVQLNLICEQVELNGV